MLVFDSEEARKAAGVRTSALTLLLHLEICGWETAQDDPKGQLFKAALQLFQAYQLCCNAAKAPGLIRELVETVLKPRFEPGLPRLVDKLLLELDLRSPVKQPPRSAGKALKGHNQKEGRAEEEEEEEEGEAAPLAPAGIHAAAAAAAADRANPAVGSAMRVSVRQHLRRSPSAASRLTLPVSAAWRIPAAWRIRAGRLLRGQARSRDRQGQYIAAGGQLHPAPFGAPTHGRGGPSFGRDRAALGSDAGPAAAPQQEGGRRPPAGRSLRSGGGREHPAVARRVQGHSDECGPAAAAGSGGRGPTDPAPRVP